MTVLKDLLAAEPKIVSVSPTASVLDAVTAMVNANCGSVVIMDGDQVAGIFTERDLMKWVIRQEGAADQMQVAELMTRDLLIAKPSDGVSSAILMMRKHHIRHLPVMEEGGPLLGVLSIRDLIREEVREMRDYIALSEG